MRSLKVLLLSPMPEVDPPGGDVTYSLTLLRNPPPGVTYEPYDRALARGTLREHGRRATLQRAFRERKKILAEAWLSAVNSSINQGRRANLLFWEPFRFFSLHTAEYDLIHLHVFSARFEGSSCPLVVSNGGELAHMYRHARGFSEPGIRRRERADRRLGKLLGVNVNSEYLPQASRLLTYTARAAESFARREVFPRERIDVVPTYVPEEPLRLIRPQPHRVGFIARHFADKGGPTLLAAWERVRAARPDAELLIAGCAPELSPAEARERRIVWQPYVPRQELLETILPTLDVFAYPTRYDYLPCFTLLEVMARGLPVAASDHPGMDEVLDGGRAGLLSPVNDPQRLAQNLLRLLQPQENHAYSLAARQQFARRYSSEAVAPALRRSYDLALRD